MAIMSEAGSILTRPSGGILATDCGGTAPPCPDLLVTVSGLTGTCDCNTTPTINCEGMNGSFVMTSNTGSECMWDGCSYWGYSPGGRIATLYYYGGNWVLTLPGQEGTDSPWRPFRPCAVFENPAGVSCYPPKTGWSRSALYGTCSRNACGGGGNVTIDY